MVDTLDHVIAGPSAAARVTGADDWQINGAESVMVQYSRYRNNITDLYEEGPFGSSDHDPIIVGIDGAFPEGGDDGDGGAAECEHPGKGHGHGKGHGNGNGNGKGQGKGHPHCDPTHPGHGNGNGHGNGKGPGHGNGPGKGSGTGNGHDKGHGLAHGTDAVRSGDGG